MSEHNDIGFFLLDVATHNIARSADTDDVVNKKLSASERDDLCLVEVQPGIVVPKNRGHRRDEFQLTDDRFVTNVARVQDVLDAIEDLGDARIEETVSVGDDADAHFSKPVDGGLSTCRRFPSRLRLFWFGIGRWF